MDDTTSYKSLIHRIGCVLIANYRSQIQIAHRQKTTKFPVVTKLTNKTNTLIQLAKSSVLGSWCGLLTRAIIRTATAICLDRDIFA